MQMHSFFFIKKGNNLRWYGTSVDINVKKVHYNRITLTGLVFLNSIVKIKNFTIFDQKFCENFKIPSGMRTHDLKN